MRLPRLRFAAASLGAAGVLCAASFDARVEALFRPPLGEMAALSPDGARVAYTTPAGGKLAIVLLELDHPGRRRRIPVEPDRAATGGEPPWPAQLRFLHWATPARLVYAPVERVVPLPAVTDPTGNLVANPDGPVILAPILAVDADGRWRGTVADARDFQETPAEALRSLADLLRTPEELSAVRQEPVHWRMPHIDILGFLPENRAQLIIGTHGAYSMPRQHAIDLRTGERREFGGEWPAPPAAPKVFDWFRCEVVGERQEQARPATLWRDADLGRLQRELEAKFPHRVVELLDWSDNHGRVLLRVTGGTDPGRVFVFQRVEDLALEIIPCAPWLPAAKLNPTRWFEFDSADGARLSGYVTQPLKPRFDPPPLLVVFPGGFPGHAQPAFDPEAQVFADMGFAVARLNHRSVAGVRAEDFAALRAAVDRVTVADAQAAIEWLATRMPGRAFDRKRVAVLGRGFGGYLALRALQQQAAEFHCGIAIDPPPDLEAWLRTTAPRDLPAALLASAGTDWRGFSVLEQAETLTNPVLLLVEPSRSAAVDAGTDELRARLRRLGRAPDYLALDAGFAAARPASRAPVYRKIEEFLNTHLPGYAVGAGTNAEAP